MEYGIYVGIATLALALIVHSIRATWRVSQIDRDSRTYTDAQIDNLQRDLVRLEKAGMERADTIRHEFGETASALRTKIHEVETWNRDTFVRKESFEMVVNRIEKSLEKLGDRFEEKLDKIAAATQNRS